MHKRLWYLYLNGEYCGQRWYPPYITPEQVLVELAIEGLDPNITVAPAIVESGSAEPTQKEVANGVDNQVL